MKHPGFGHWLVQRISAVFLALVTLALALFFATSPPASYAEWTRVVGHPAVAVTLALYLGVMLLHAWVGVQDIVVDYIKPILLRLTALSIAAFLLLACGVWGASVFFSVVIQP